MDRVVKNWENTYSNLYPAGWAKFFASWKLVFGIRSWHFLVAGWVLVVGAWITSKCNHLTTSQILSFLFRFGQIYCNWRININLRSFIILEAVDCWYAGISIYFFIVLSDYYSMFNVSIELFLYTRVQAIRGKMWWCSISYKGIQTGVINKPWPNMTP